MLLARLDLFFTLLALACALASVVTQRLFTQVVLMTAFSFISSSLFFIFDAVDVAFTEAAVGVGLSTVLILATIIFTGDLSEKKRKQHGRPFYAVQFFLLLATLVLLVFLLHDAPPFGVAEAIVHRSVADTYILQTPHDMGIKNVVSAILAGYRGYDTLGETVVVLIAYVAVASIFPSLPRQGVDKTFTPGSVLQERHLVLRVISKSMLPIVGLFAFYVQWHGDDAPGGGFQAGIILSTCCVIYGLLNGFKKTASIFPKRFLLIQATSGVLLYAGVGTACMLLGYPFLDYRALSTHTHFAQHLGIFLVEFGVGMTVSAVSALIYLAFISRTTPLFQRKSVVSEA